MGIKLDARADGYVHNMNLTGLTSSRSESRTNAYMARILLLDGNTFSSCVRSGKHTLIVVYFIWGQRPTASSCVITMIDSERGKYYVHSASDRASSSLAARAARASTMARCSSRPRERADVAVYL